MEEQKKQAAVSEYTLEQIKAMNIWERILHMQAEVGWVKKDLNVVTKTDQYGNPLKSYAAVGEANVNEAAKEVESKYRVLSIPVAADIIESGMIESTSEKQAGKIWLRLKIVTRFINVDKPSEFVDITSYGDGIDTGDKATGKAMTYGCKYGIMKGLKMTTGDDPDAEPSDEEPKKITKNAAPKEPKQESGTEELATPSQLNFMKTLFTEVEIAGFLDFYKIDTPVKITKKNAAAMIDKKIKMNNQEKENKN